MNPLTKGTQPLTNDSIRKSQPGDVLHDVEVRGLHLRVFPPRRGRSEPTRTFYLYYRTKTRVQRRPKIGEWGTITLAQARILAREMLFAVLGGLDPIEERQKQRDAHTVEQLAELYWDKHASKQKSAADFRRHLDKHILPNLGKKRVADLIHADAEALHTHIAKTAPHQANRALATLSKMMSLAEKWQMRPLNSNPCKHLDKTKENKRQRYMKGEEAPKIAAALLKYEATRPQAVAFLMLLILTGARRNEIAAARWEWLDGNVLRLPDSKTGRRDIHLPQAAMNALARLPRIEGQTIVGIRTPDSLWNIIRRECECPDLRIHDLRHYSESRIIPSSLPG
jgi:integrase